MEAQEIMYGTYFFLQQSINEYSYEANNFVSLYSELGGFIEIMYITLSIIPFLYNYRKANQKFIEKLYVVEKEQEDPSENHSQSDASIYTKF